jgi:WD40 repeat protein
MLAPSVTPSPAATKLPPAESTLLPTTVLTIPHIQFSPWDLIHAVAWSADGDHLAVSAGENVHVYDAAQLNQDGALVEIHSLPVGAWANRLAFQPIQGAAPLLLALVAKDGSLQIWDGLSGEKLCSIQAHNKGANSLDFSPDGSLLASTGNDAIVRLWEIPSLPLSADCELSLRAEMIGGAYVVPAIRFSPSGESVASVDLHNIRLRDPLTQRLINTLYGETSIFCLAFHPAGTLLAAGELGNTVRLWDMQTGEAGKVLSWQGSPRAFIWDVAFSPDGGMLAAAGSDGFVTLWEVASGQVLGQWQVSRLAVTSVAFSPDGKWLAAGGLDAAVHLWIVADYRK